MLGAADEQARAHRTNLKNIASKTTDSPNHDCSHTTVFCLYIF
jgi:hypothetical protein